MKNIFILIVLLLITSSRAQEKKYYEFGYKDKYGIVDQTGEEIFAPIYNWSVYTLDEKSNYIALNSHEIGGLVVNTESGTIQKFDYMRDTHIINLDDEKFFYAYDKNGSYLLNTLDSEKKIVLPKKYFDIKQEGNYLFCYIDNENADILSKADRKAIRKNFPVVKSSSYQTEGGQTIYVLEQKEGTLFLDENLKQIVFTEKILDSFEQIKEFLSSKKIILKVEDTTDYIELFTPKYKENEYPRIDIKTKGSLIEYNIDVSETKSRAFFKFNKKSYSFYNYTPSENKLRLATVKGNRIFMKYEFSFDPRTQTVLFPQKYWNEIELQLIK